jgi:hypothetical protein
MSGNVNDQRSFIDWSYGAAITDEVGALSDDLWTATETTGRCYSRDADFRIHAPDSNNAFNRWTFSAQVIQGILSDFG